MRGSGDILLLRDLLADSIRENTRLRRINETLSQENALLRERRADFDLSADAELPALLRKQIG